MRRQRRTDPRSGDARGAAVTRKPVDAAIRDLAARQHGVLTRAQLLELGFAPGAVDRSLKAGRLQTLQRGVYVLGPVLPPLAREMAAVMSCGHLAVLSHRTAAHHWHLLLHPARSNDPIEVTVAGRDPGARPGVRIHRVRSLEPDEVTKLQRIPITTPARTLLDLAAGNRLENSSALSLRQLGGAWSPVPVCALSLPGTRVAAARPR
jgi:hypothetical protein